MTDPDDLPGSDPERLIAQTEDNLLRSVLRAGRAERPPRAAYERTAAAMGLPSATGLAPAARVTTGGALHLARLAKGGALLAIGAGLVFGVRHFVVSAPPSPVVVAATSLAVASPPPPSLPAVDPAIDPPSPRALPAPLPDSPSGPAATPPSSLSSPSSPASALRAPSSARSAAEPAAPRPEPEPTARPDSAASVLSPASAAPAASVVARPSLALEVAALDEARSLLASGNAPGALARLDRYQQEFPQGILQQEALFVRVDALMRAGQRPAALALGEPFLAAHPASPLARRMRSLLGKDQPPAPSSSSPTSPSLVVP
jgi:hypothetical protein